MGYSFEVVQEVKDHPQYGAYVNGLFLEGARWDGTKLDESYNRELFFEFPIVRIIQIWIKPSVEKANEANKYKCPLYRTLLRAGSLTTTGHSTNFILAIYLNTSLPSLHWAKRGVALFTQLDD